MTSKEFLQGLFHLHVADLNDVLQENGITFICPICMKEYSLEDLGSENLTDGHVWPEYLRQKSKSRIASNQRVLLCKACNNTAGSRGDKQMQLREIIKDAEKAGQLYDEREVQILPGSGRAPIELRAKINLKEGDMAEGQLSFEIDRRTGQWARNNPKEQERFLDATKGEKFAMTVYPPHELKSELPPAGWITSAYLLAFYTFGYRYILHPSINIVRDYILQSFEEASKALRMPDLNYFGLTECKEHYFEDPEIALVIPADREKRIHLRVSYLDYHIRLPFHFVPHVLQALILSVPDIAEEFSSHVGTDAYLYSPISCNKFEAHDCKWDYVLGKPIPD